MKPRLNVPVVCEQMRDANDTSVRLVLKVPYFL